MTETSKKQLVFNIIEFLRQSTLDGTVKEDDKESLEVAGQFSSCRLVVVIRQSVSQSDKQTDRLLARIVNQ